MGPIRVSGTATRPRAYVGYRHGARPESPPPAPPPCTAQVLPRGPAAGRSGALASLAAPGARLGSAWPGHGCGRGGVSPCLRPPRCRPVCGLSGSLYKPGFELLIACRSRGCVEPLPELPESKITSVPASLADLMAPTHEHCQQKCGG